MVLIPQDTFTEEIINLLNSHANTLRSKVEINSKRLSSTLYTFTYCLGGVGITFACNGSVTVDCRDLPAPSLSTVSEIWPELRKCNV